MMSMTHALYARSVRDHILLKFNVKLKTASLIYGSVKPDASTIFAKYPHYIDKSLSVTDKRIELLVSCTKNVKEIETRAFARELGVVLHYIADYFCRVHNDINGIKHTENYKHVMYEQRLHQKIKKENLGELREEALYAIDKNLDLIKNSSVTNYILINNKRYMKEAGKLFLYNNSKKRYDIDIKYSFEMVLSTADYIINKILEGEKYEETN